MTLDPTVPAPTPAAPDPGIPVTTAQIVNDHAARKDAAARAAADASAAKAPAKREPPSWAKLEERAAAINLRLVGPIMPGAIASAGIERMDGTRVAGCQAIDRDGQLAHQQDRILRAQLGAALWILEEG